MKLFLIKFYVKYRIQNYNYTALHNTLILREFSIDSLYSWVWVTLSCFFACLVSFLLETWHFRYYIVATLDSVGLLLLFLGGVCLVVCLDKFCEVHCPTHFPSSPPQCTTIDVSAQFEFKILVMFKLQWP